MKGLTKIEKVIIDVCDTCFFKCKMCSVWKNKSKSPLNFKSYLQLFKDLKHITGESTQILFTGGEPLLEKKIFSLIDAANNNDYYTVLVTNGWLLNNENIINLFKTKLNLIMMSLDGSCPEIHDNLRGMPGSFNKIILACKKIVKYNRKSKHKIKIGITTVINAYNLIDVLNIIDLVEKTEYINHIWLQVVVAPLADKSIMNDGSITDEKTNELIPWYEHNKFNKLWPNDKNKLKKVYSNLIYLTQHSSKIKNNINTLHLQYNYFIHPDNLIKNNTDSFMHKDLLVEANGDVYLSTIKRINLGNIKYKSINKIFGGEKNYSSKINNLRYHFQINCGIQNE